MCDNRAERHCSVDPDRDLHRAMHTEERKQRHAADKASCAGTKRVDVVKNSDRAADVAGAMHEVVHQNRERCAHEKRWHDDKRKVDRRHGGEWPPGRERTDLIEDAKRHESERAGDQLDYGE